METYPRQEMAISVGDFEFRVVEDLMRPQEVFFAYARRCFAAGEFERALALAETYRTLDGMDLAAIRLIADVEAKGITMNDIPPEVAQGVRREYETFQAIPEELRNSLIRPENHIAIHPFEVKVAMLERWKIESPGPITTRVIAQGSSLWSTCERIEYDIFTAPDTGYFPPNNCRRLPDFDHFGRQEFIAVARADRIVGVIRLVYAEGKRLGVGMFQTYDHRQELNIFPERDKYLETLDARKVVDMSSMAIERSERDSRASKALINASIQRIWETGRRHILACIDTPFYRKLKGRALDFRDLGPSTYCWGSPTTACILDSYSIPKGASRGLIPYCRAKGFVERVLGKGGA